jgi:hypothetical protein
MTALDIFSRTMAMGSTQPGIFLGVKGDRRLGLTSQLSVNRLSGKYGIVDVSQPCGPPQPVTGVALPFLSFRVRFLRFMKCVATASFVFRFSIPKEGKRHKFYENVLIYLMK